MSRQSDIVELLSVSGFVSTAGLASAFGVTPSTIRRDLHSLENLQLVERTHGGAIPVRQADAPFHLKGELHRPEKMAIGRAMAHRILDGQVVLLDSGTTTLEVARNLTSQRLTVVTNDLRIAMTISELRNAHLVFIGGELVHHDTSMWGPTAVSQLERLRVNVAVMGADTVMEDGLYSTTSYELEIKRTMRQIAGEAFFVADSSKFGREALFQTLRLDEFTAGITDDHLDPIRAASFPVTLIRASV